MHFQQQSRMRSHQTPGGPLRSYTPVIVKPAAPNVHRQSVKPNVPNIAVTHVKKVEESFTEEDSFEEMIRAEMENLETSMSGTPSAQKVQVKGPAGMLHSAPALQKEGATVVTSHPDAMVHQETKGSTVPGTQSCIEKGKPCEQTQNVVKDSINVHGEKGSVDACLTPRPVLLNAQNTNQDANHTPMMHRQIATNTPLTSKQQTIGGNLNTPRETISGSSFDTASEDPVIARKRALQKQKFMRLAQYGTPSNLSALNSPIPQTVRSAFKPPSMSASNTLTGSATRPSRAVGKSEKENMPRSECNDVPKMESLSPPKESISREEPSKDDMKKVTSSIHETVEKPVVDSVNPIVDKNDQNVEENPNVISTVPCESNVENSSVTNQNVDEGEKIKTGNSAIKSNTGSGASCVETDEPKCVKQESHNIVKVTEDAARIDDLACSQTSEASISSVVSDGALMRPKRGRPRKRQRTGSLSETQAEVEPPPTKRRASLRLSRSKKSKL